MVRNTGTPRPPLTSPTQADRKVAKELLEQSRREAAEAKRKTIPKRPAAESIATVPSVLAEPAPAPLNRRKHAAFLRLAEPRMSNLLHYFRANIMVLTAVERYDYTREEAEATIGAVEQTARDLRGAFQQRGKRRLRDEFSFQSS